MFRVCVHASYTVPKNMTKQLDTTEKINGILDTGTELGRNAMQTLHELLKNHQLLKLTLTERHISCTRDSEI